eukprot:TRINITY_DN6827_c0_g1_i4.p1 TRINITY_DN6827_c0_g1~~TRINITY_DN6827_c0_g1_i4.p1  ORF type:complete len:321 (+),score=40.33 TRINITY_DN6827_c0_g1_i4:113-1075(+)
MWKNVSHIIHEATAVVEERAGDGTPLPLSYDSLRHLLEEKEHMDAQDQRTKLTEMMAKIEEQRKELHFCKMNHAAGAKEGDIEKLKTYEENIQQLNTVQADLRKQLADLQTQLNYVQDGKKRADMRVQLLERTLADWKKKVQEGKSEGGNLLIVPPSTPGGKISMPALGTPNSLTISSSTPTGAIIATPTPLATTATTTATTAATTATTATTTAAKTMSETKKVPQSTRTRQIESKMSPQKKIGSRTQIESKTSPQKRLLVTTSKVETVRSGRSTSTVKSAVGPATQTQSQGITKDRKAPRSEERSQQECRDRSRMPSSA